MIKKIFSVLFYVGAGFFLLIAIILFFSLEDDSRLFAFGIFLLFALFLSFIGYQISRIGKNKGGKQANFLEIKIEELDEEKKQIDKEKLAQKYAKQFTDNQIQGFSVQILESKHILQNTKNLNTYKSRWSFFEEKVQKMSLLHGSYNYEDNIKIGVQKYKDLYPDRIVQKSFLTDIDSFDESAFFEKSFYKCVNHFVESEKTAIEKLKTPRAKENRLLKINDFVIDCLVFIHNRGYSKDDLFYAKIEEFRETI